MADENARSWFVLSVVTLSVFLEIGIIKAFSVLLPDLKEQLETKTWIVGSSIAIIIGFGYLIGLTSGSLVNRFSPRSIVMTSGLIASVGLIVCSYALSPFTLLIGLILTGFLLLQENILIGVIPDYFDKHYATAVGIYTCGTGLGIVIFPIVTQILLDVYGWRGAVLLLGGLSFHSVPCGAVLAFHKPVKRKTYKGGTYEQFVNHSKNGTLCGEEEEELHHETKQILIQKIIRASGLGVFKKCSFITEVLVVAMATGYILTGWMVYTISFAVSRGLSIKQGSIIATTGGIGLVLIRISISLLHKTLTYRQLLPIGSVTTAISLSLTAFCNSYIALNIVALLFGVGYGILGAELYVAAKENSEDSEYQFAIAWLHVVYGASAIVSGVLTGLVYDTTGSFTVSFNLLAVMSLSISLSLGLGHLLENNEHDK